MKKNKIYVCGLSETKLVSSKLQLMHKLRLKQWRMFSNVEATSVARIVVLWNPSTVNVDSIDSSPQALHAIIRNLETQFTCATTFVYGYNSVSARRPLWDYLRRRAPSCPWIVFGVPFITASCLMVWICWLCFTCLVAVEGCLLWTAQLGFL